MTLVDANLLLYAYNDGSPFYSVARSWWEDLVNGPERIGVPWVVVVGFVRLIINPNNATDVASLLSNLNPHKATGLNNILFLKETAHYISLLLTFICQSSITQEKLPSEWKYANVIPIYKKGSRTSSKL